MSTRPRRARQGWRLPVLLCVTLLWTLGGATVTANGGSRAGRPAGATHSQMALALQTASAIATMPTPPRDLLDLSRRLRLHQIAPIDPYVVTTPRDYPVGHEDSFYVAYAQSGFFSMKATILYKTAHAYWYFASGVKPDMAALIRSARVFEARTYPTNHANFGVEWQPGIDRDPRLTILSGKVPGVGGYYSAEDLYPRRISPYSNQRKMLYLNTESATVGTAGFDATLAHEFQHMIHWHMHPRDDAWINEGSSMLAQQLNGYTADGDDGQFAQMPDTQLDAWSINSDRDIAHYGGSFLWMLYFYQHYGGQKALRTLLANSDKTGMALFDDTLRKLGSPDTSTDMFRKWVIANYLDNPALGDGSYGYRNWSVRAAISRTVSALPATVSGKVPQYATNYIDLKPVAGSTAPLTVTFHGNVTTPLLSVAIDHSFWWSNRGDVMDTTLTHPFDLRHVKAATLRYALWYDTEKDFDYGYVEVSTDSGQTWYTQRATHTTDHDPNGQNYGNGYTGASGGWVRETVDLSRYAGKAILVRFEHVTDDSYNQQGLALASVSIPEIGFADGAAADSGWQSAGWVHVGNVLPETWLVQAIVQGPRGTKVIPLTVTDGAGSLALKTDGVDHVVLAVSPLAPQTTVDAQYSLSVSQ